MLRVARETSILFNDEYLNYQPSIQKVQERIQKDIELLQLEADDYKDAVDFCNDRGLFYKKESCTKSCKELTCR